MVTAGILPFRENSHGRAGNRTRDLMISSQRLWPLDHEAGHSIIVYSRKHWHLRSPVYSVTVHSRTNPDICSVRYIQSLYIVGQTLIFAASGIFSHSIYSDKLWHLQRLVYSIAVHSQTTREICSVRYIQSLYTVGQTLKFAAFGIFSHCTQTDKPWNLQRPVYSVTVHRRTNPEICSVRYI